MRIREVVIWPRVLLDVKQLIQVKVKQLAVSVEDYDLELAVLQVRSKEERAILVHDDLLRLDVVASQVSCSQQRE